ncbi:hypothetical protein BDV34DRAFT_195261 [Aspergillus parasiticus]|uniref:Uncharacterized protein n=1 Tax=Aspergillus parasiticus TaxID=5067 RepID=A0A5N6DLB8_ASPPA|nr:hypothetical protein BDV34DRAFT_195261 [Aspergillus parasiticus]
MIHLLLPYPRPAGYAVPGLPFESQYTWLLRPTIAMLLPQSVYLKNQRSPGT